MNISDFGIKFLLLALRIDKHIKGYVDYYIGPSNLRKIVQNEILTSPNKLLKECETLQKNVLKQGYDKKRERYIEKHLGAMKTLIEVLNGMEISIEDQFLYIFDIILQPIKESELDNLKEEINIAYSGIESLEIRLNRVRASRTVPGNKVYELFKKALSITREQTKKQFVNNCHRKKVLS